MKPLTAALALGALSLFSAAQAAYVPPGGAMVAATGLPVDGNCAFARGWGWTFPAAGADNLPAVTGSNWTVNLTSGALANGRSLTATITHVDPAADGICDVAHAASPAHVLNFGPAEPPPPGNPGPLQRPNAGNFIKSAAAQEGHGTHFDVVSATVTVPAAGNAGIVVKGRHAATAGTFVASLENLTGGNVTATVTPDFRKADNTLVNGSPINLGTLGNGAHPNIRLPQNNADLNPLASYIIRAAGSPATETHLAFLGLVDGVFTELDLAAATLLFVGLDEFLVPVLGHDTDDIFVAVDLVQWLSNPLLPSLNQGFTITDGVSPDLPGFLFSHTAIDFTPGVGFETTGKLNNETVSFRGLMIDGHVPEPPTLAMLGLGLAVLLSRARRPRRAA